MKRTPRNIFYHELIGLQVKVLDHISKTCVGLEGRIIDETRNTLVILNGAKPKRILKKGGKFLFKLSDRVYVVVRGEEILGRPEDRIKLRLR